MKKFWKYFTIVLLLLAGLFCVGLLYLFFVPGSSLFGLTYISYNKKLESSVYHKSTVHTIQMNSRAYEVDIVTSASENVSAVAYSRSFGYTVKKYSTVNLTSSLDNGVLTITITEPHGAVLHNRSHIELRIPKDYTPALHLKNKSSTTTIDSKNIKLSALKYSTVSGECNIEKATISNNLELNLNKAKFSMTKDVILDNVNASLKLSSGQFNASSHNFKSVNVLGNSYGVIDIKSCDNFVMHKKSAGGTIKIDTATAVDIESSDTNISIKNLHGGQIILTETGKVNINTLHGYSSVQTGSGSIKILHTNAPVELLSTSGNQIVYNATRCVTATSTSGDISVEFADNAEGYDGTDFASRKLVAISKNGNITAAGVENVTIDIDTKGMSDINLTMRNVIGLNAITAKRGNVNVQIPSTSEYSLTTESSTGSVHVNAIQFDVGGFTDNKRTTTWISSTNLTPVNDYSLVITTTSGNLKVFHDLVI